MLLAALSHKIGAPSWLSCVLHACVYGAKMLTSFEAWEGFASPKLPASKNGDGAGEASSGGGVATLSVKMPRPKTASKSTVPEQVKTALQNVDGIIAEFSHPDEADEVWKDPKFYPDSKSLAPDWAAFEAANSGGGTGEKRKSHKWATAKWHPAKDFMGEGYRQVRKAMHSDSVQKCVSCKLCWAHAGNHVAQR